MLLQLCSLLLRITRAKKKITFSYIVKLAVQSTKASDYNAEQRNIVEKWIMNHIHFTGAVAVVIKWLSVIFLVV